MAMLKTHKVRLYVSILISISLTILFAFTIFRSGFLSDLPHSTIQITATSQKNFKSGGSDVRLKSVKINNQDIPLSELNADYQWRDMDELLIAVNPDTPAYIEYEGDYIRKVEIEFQKHDGSGIAEIAVNGKTVKKLDLYAPDWSTIVYSSEIGKVSIMKHIPLFIAIWIGTFATIQLASYLAEKDGKRQYKKYVLWAISLLGLLSLAFKNSNGSLENTVFCLVWLLSIIMGIVRMVIIKAENKKTYVYSFLRAVLILTIAFLSWMQLEIGCHYTETFQFLGIELKYIILNILTIVVLINVLAILVNRWWISSLVISTILLIVSIANYFVIQFHAMPLSVNELRNIGTAAGVIGSYKFSVDSYVLFMLLFYLLSLVFVNLLKETEAGETYTWKQIIFKDAVVCVLSLGILHKGYWSENPIKAAKNIEYAWQDTFHEYGYVACSIDLIRQAITVIQEPKGYSDERIAELVSSLKQSGEGGNRTPDVILILNETFFDLRQVADIHADQEFLHYWDTMPNVVKGYAVAPIDGGGTNCSEYELLTGNSLQLMPGITPFYVLDLENANSIASHLGKLGYETLAAHSESENSYNRLQSYPKLGFQQVRFDLDFKNKEYYGNRQFYETDESVYRNLIQWYEEMPENKPRFLYLLTIQNHGDWNINDSSDDIVHVSNDFGDSTEKVNEYLSCIKQSDEAFKQLTDYFSSVDRDVVVCMVGDHSPYLAGAVMKEGFSEAEKSLRLRGTPFMVWSNRELEEENTGYVSLNYLPSIILDAAGIPSMPYYKYMGQLRKKLPVVSSYGKYFDSDGNEYDYEEETVYTSEVQDYFYLEFNNLMKNLRNQELFEPINGGE